MIDFFNKGKLKNAINIPIADTSLMNKLKSYYSLAELMGSAQAQLSNGALKTVEINCYGSAEDSKSISLAFLKGLLSNITDNRINFINAAAIAKERGIKFSHMYSNDNMPYLNVIESKVSSVVFLKSLYTPNGEPSVFFGGKN